MSLSFAIKNRFLRVPQYISSIMSTTAISQRKLNANRDNLKRKHQPMDRLLGLYKRLVRVYKTKFGLGDKTAKIKSRHKMLWIYDHAISIRGKKFADDRIGPDPDRPGYYGTNTTERRSVHEDLSRMDTRTRIETEVAEFIAERDLTVTKDMAESYIALQERKVPEYKRTPLPPTRKRIYVKHHHGGLSCKVGVSQEPIQRLKTLNTDFPGHIELCFEMAADVADDVENIIKDFLKPHLLAPNSSSTEVFGLPGAVVEFEIKTLLVRLDVEHIVCRVDGKDLIPES